MAALPWNFYVDLIGEVEMDANPGMEVLDAGHAVTRARGMEAWFKKRQNKLCLRGSTASWPRCRTSWSNVKKSGLV